jgi:hypothetical protein
MRRWSSGHTRRGFLACGQHSMVFSSGHRLPCANPAESPTAGGGGDAHQMPCLCNVVTIVFVDGVSAEEGSVGTDIE